MGLATKHHVFQVRHSGEYHRAAPASSSSSTRPTLSPPPAVQAPAGNQTCEVVGGAGVPVRRPDGSAHAKRRSGPIFQGPRGGAVFSPVVGRIGLLPLVFARLQCRFFANHRPGELSGKDEQKTGWKELRALRIPNDPRARSFDFFFFFLVCKTPESQELSFRRRSPGKEGRHGPEARLLTGMRKAD